MTGVNEYNNKLNNKINNFVAKNPEIGGYCNYLRTDKSLTSVYQYITIVSTFLNNTNKKQTELTFDDFTNYISLKTKENGIMITSSFQIQKYHALKNYSSYLFEIGCIPKNYMLSIKRPKPIESQETLQKREKSYLNKNELKLYIQTIKDGIWTKGFDEYYKAIKIRDFAIIMIFLTTGIRRSAMVKLDVNDIDYNQKMLWVTDKGNQVHGYNLNEMTLDAIKEWNLKRNEWIYPGKETEALFISKYGSRLQEDGISEIVTKYAVHIKGKRITPHKLRATYGTQLYEATKDIYFVQKAMGHSTPTVTERYIRGQKGVTKQAADIMSKLI